MQTSLRLQVPLPSPVVRLPQRRRCVVLPVRAVQRGDFNQLLRDAWRTANDGFEQFLFEAKRIAERIDRKYSVTSNLSAMAESASIRARELDRDLQISSRWRSFSTEVFRNWPRYRKQISDFLDTPLGRSFATLFFVWLALSGWLFRFIILATWVLPLAGPLLIGIMANNLIIKGACPSCKRQFVGYKNKVVRCGGCGNIVWQPKNDFSSGNGRNNRSGPEIIDVDFEEK